MDKNDLSVLFEKRFGTGEIRTYHSPGRINLIGEHTDYNGGYVFPCSLSIGTYACAKKRDDHLICLASADFPETLTISDYSSCVYKSGDGWTNYAKGVILEFVRERFPIGGFEIMFSGNIPNGAGLSSSASLELCLAVAINDMFSLGVEMTELVNMSRRAENEFVGVNCGIMDQFAVGMGKEEHAIFLNCRDLSFKYVPMQLGSAKIVIANTNKRRELADSKYNERRLECEKALSILQTKADISCLGELSAQSFEELSYLITDETILKRAQHVVYEDDRTLKAVQCLMENDIAKFGGFMVQSHESLRDLYEVTGIELDTLVSEALKIDGVYGSRMTGAGFGGCTISIVEAHAIDTFIKTVGDAYAQKTGLNADFYIAEIADGAKRIL